MSQLPSDPNSPVNTAIETIKHLPVPVRFFGFTLVVVAIIMLSTPAIPENMLIFFYVIIGLATLVYLFWEYQQMKIRQIQGEKERLSKAAEYEYQLRSKELELAYQDKSDEREHERTLRKQENEKPTPPQVQATVDHGGAAAIGDGATAVGQNATFIKGNVSGNVITGSGNTISSASLNPEAPAIPPSLTRLHHNLLNAFNQDELEALCLELGIDHESLRGQSKSQLARLLVLHCHHHGRVAELRAKGQNLRSHLAWE